MISALAILCAFVLVFTTIWYFYYLHCFNYWKKKNVPTISPTFPAGNITNIALCRENLFVTIAEYHKKFKNEGHKHGGLYFFNSPVYLPVDPEIIKRMLITDFEHFTDRGVFVDPEKFPITDNIFNQTGARWKNMRNKISPTFTSGKLKNMYEMFLAKAETFINVVGQSAEKEGEINIKRVSSNFTTDIIFSSGFGLESGTLNNPDNKVAKMSRDFLISSKWAFFKTFLAIGFHNPGNLLLSTLDDRSFEYNLRDIIQKTIKHRDQNNIIRKDFLSLLLEMKDELTFDEILAQCFVFFIAGFETSSQTISYCIHELAHNQELQDKLRKEIWDNLGQDFRNFKYADLLQLPYLDKVFNETMRLYPVLGFLNRICVKPYQVPGTNVVIDKGTPVLISLLGLQRDPEYFPDPLKFDPDRFDENQTVLPFSFMPFGEGPRICIGMRHGKLQTKLGIAALISQFKFYPSEDTPKYVEYDKFVTTLAMTPTKGITVKVTKV